MEINENGNPIFKSYEVIGKAYLAFDIEWDVSVEDVLVYADENGFTEDEYDIEYFYDAYSRNDMGKLYKVLGLPEEIEIPENIEAVAIQEQNDEVITEWLTNHYGYCIKGYSLAPELEDMIRSGRYDNGKRPFEDMEL